jgi:Ser/Thr protein kinase RdoA (MazF antagonist)
METMSLNGVAALVEENYGVKVAGTPEEMHERDGQRVFYVPLADETALTVRLCTVYRPLEKVMGDTGALLFLQHVKFPAPRLRLTVTGERVFQWGAGAWGYAQEFIPGENPTMELPVLIQLAGLLGQLHNLVNTFSDYPVQVGWLDELPEAIRRGIAASNDPTWGKKAQEIVENLKTLPDLRALPLALIHTDVHEGNLVLTPDDKLYMLDWEDAGLGEAIFDVALVLGWNCVYQSDDLLKKFRNKPPEKYEFDEEYCTTLLRTYQSVRPLSDLEAEMLGPAIRFLMGWFSTRDIAREIAEPGVSEGLAFTNWAIMRSVTPEWSAQLTEWAKQTRPGDSQSFLKSN